MSDRREGGDEACGATNVMFLMPMTDTFQPTARALHARPRAPVSMVREHVALARYEKLISAVSILRQRCLWGGGQQSGTARLGYRHA